MTRYVIHNHLPARARDAEQDPHKAWMEEQRRKQNEGGGSFHDNRDATKPDFDTWMKQVDRAVSAKTGVSVHDLPDCSFRDWYDQGVSASSAAARCVKAAKSEGYDGRDFRGVVNRDEEERNRDRMYKDTGIRRVKR
jgi:hypothetical protein